MRLPATDFLPCWSLDHPPAHTVAWPFRYARPRATAWSLPGSARLSALKPSLRLTFIVVTLLGAGCDNFIKLDKKTEKQLQSAAKSTEKAAKVAANDFKKLAKDAVKDAQKPVEEANIPDLATSNGRGEVPLACRAVDAAGNPIAVADENRWRKNVRCR